MWRDCTGVALLMQNVISTKFSLRLQLTATLRVKATMDQVHMVSVG